MAFNPMGNKDSGDPSFFDAMIQKVLSGGIAGMMAKTATAPLERIQILNQTGAATDTMYGTFRRILTDGGGFRGLWRGNLVNCFRVFPHKSILFTANDYLQRRALPLVSSPFLTGAVSGVIATAAIYPIVVVRAHLSGTFAKTNSAVRVLQHVVKSEGLVGLYRGFAVTLMGTFPFEGIRMGAYALLRGYLPTKDTPYGPQPHPVGKMCAGATAGAAAAFATYPTDTVRRMLQVQSAEGMVRYGGLFQCITVNYRQGGVKRFYHGLSAKMVRVIPDAAILFVSYEFIKDFLYRETATNS